MNIARKLSFLVFLLCILMSLKNQYAETKKGSQLTPQWFLSYDAESTLFEASSASSQKRVEERNLIESKLQIDVNLQGSLKYDYYKESCPFAEQIVRRTVRDLFKQRQDVAPALLRLAFHDCFIEGCDASVLLDPAEGIRSEKESVPNESLKGFDLIDMIKSEIEDACPGVVSCADIVVLAARESINLAGGPFYPLRTGRRDSNASFMDKATVELPSPRHPLSMITKLFASRGFDRRETVSLLGAHSTGMVHCRFFRHRLFNFNNTDQADPSINIEFLNSLRLKCNNSHVSVPPSASPLPSEPPALSTLDRRSLSASLDEPGMNMDYEGPGSGFGTVYYRSLLQGRGILFADQQLTSDQETETWVRAYASDISLFRKDFTVTMTKLSNLKVLTAPSGHIRVNCRKVAA